MRLGLAGVALCAAALGTFAWDGVASGLFPLQVAAYILGAILVVNALIARFRHPVLVVLGVGVVALVIGGWVYAADFLEHVRR